MKCPRELRSLLRDVLAMVIRCMRRTGYRLHHWQELREKALRDMTGGDR